MALITTGGFDLRLHHLTRSRDKADLPFAGQFRIIDFALSNCVNSGIRRIGLLPQYQAYSLIRHVQQSWPFLRGEFDEFIEFLPIQNDDQDNRALSTAQAISQNLAMLGRRNPDQVLVLAGDHIYKMDYGPLLAFHAEHDADLTIACIELANRDTAGHDLIGIDDDRRVLSLTRNPLQPQATPDNSHRSLVSMSAYVFNTSFLIRQLVGGGDVEQASWADAAGLVPARLAEHRVFAYPFHEIQGRHAYWRTIDNVDAYWRANLELVEMSPELNLYDRDWPIWTYHEQLSPARFVIDQPDCRGTAFNSMVADGCILSGATVRQSLLFSNVRVEQYSFIEDSVVLPNARIGQNCRIKRALIDANVRLPDNSIVGEDLELDAQRFHLTPDGVVLVTADMLERPGDADR